MKKTIALLFGILLVISCTTSNDSNTTSNDSNGNSNTTGLPTLTTKTVSSIAATTAVSGGIIANDGGAAIIQKGLCWSTSANPTIALTTKTSSGMGTGAFTSNLTSLTVNTTYYVRAYATNGVGTAYGNQVSFTTLQNANGTNIAGPNITDIDGNAYTTVTNCGLTFAKQNLNVSKYSDGTPIPQVTSQTAWQSTTIGAWCYYNNDPASEAVYGKLYNWYAVAGIYNAAAETNPALRKKLAPTGWHVPTDAEWTSLTNCLGGQTIAGGKIKSTGTIQAATGLWNAPNTGATNASGFTGLPGGYRYNFGTFANMGFNGYWWSSSEINTALSWNHSLNYDNGDAGRDGFYKKYGFSVRCVRD